MNEWIKYRNNMYYVDMIHSKSEKKLLSTVAITVTNQEHGKDSIIENNKNYDRTNIHVPAQG